MGWFAIVVFLVFAAVSCSDGVAVDQGVLNEPVDDAVVVDQAVSSEPVDLAKSWRALAGQSWG